MDLNHFESVDRASVELDESKVDIHCTNHTLLHIYRALSLLVFFRKSTSMKSFWAKINIRDKNCT